MCLNNITSEKPQTAKKDIKVWKYLKKNEEGYFTPWQGVIIELGKKYTTKLQSQASKEIEFAIYSFEEIASENLLDKINTWSNHFCKAISLYLVECTIPKGSKYFKGKWQKTGANSYASDTIIYTNNIRKVI